MHAVLEIKRFEHEKNQATRGVQLLNGEFVGFSLECPNLGNTPFKSRIDPGVYTARKVATKKRGKFWLLDDKNGRTMIILNHAGSLLKDFKGCTGLGNKLGTINDERAIFNTRKTCKKFMKLTKKFNTMTVIVG